VLFDLLLHCDSARARATDGTLGFRVNHVMVGPINKTLDLVVTVAPADRPKEGLSSFASLVTRYGIQLDREDRSALARLPPVYEDARTDTHEVAIALEAKACMTEHSKSLPRLHAEVLATGYLAKQAAPHCIAVSYSLVNAATTFFSPARSGKSTKHSQPSDARRVIDMLAKAIPRVSPTSRFGYDVIGVTAIDCRNDGTPVTLAAAAASPRVDEHVHYERMIGGLCGAFRDRFRA
jgi:hypothetical protein